MLNLDNQRTKAARQKGGSQPSLWAVVDEKRRLVLTKGPKVEGHNAALVSAVMSISPRAKSLTAYRPEAGGADR